MIPAVLIKLIIPKVLDIVIKQFKMDKVMKYVEEDKALDVKVRDLEDKILKWAAHCQVLVEAVKKDLHHVTPICKNCLMRLLNI